MHSVLSIVHCHEFNHRITQIKIEGAPSYLTVPQNILPSLPVDYDDGTIKYAMLGISKFFSENGYPYNKVTMSTDVNNNDSSAIIVRFIVDTDEKVCNGPVLIKGVKKNPQMYMRDVRLSPGQIYNSADLDETIRRLSMRPYVLNVNSASPVIIEDAPLCNELRQAVTPILITEKAGMDIEGVLGYESARRGRKSSLSGYLNFSFINMLRLGERAEVSYTGMNSFQRLKVFASRPWVFSLPLEMGGSFELEIEDEGYGYLGGEFFTAAEIDGRWKTGVALRGSETVPPDTVERAYTFYGADIFLYLIPQTWEMGKTVNEFSVRTGSGIANRDKKITRSRAELSAGSHLPLFTRYAIAGRVCGKTLFTDEQYLPPAELYRYGGHNSMRGYSQEEFAFRSALISQTEALIYLSRSSSLFIFFDGGIGFQNPGAISVSDGQKMFGYGAGMRFPSRLGTVSLEWGRNIDDDGSLGRVHVGVKTGF
ncbi:MAG: BamA/TamA family outer membrane protein [Chitinispirillia bacterium]|nr:BamA/TamA family outer membrane protein [Chitinispirillia bacterium]